CCWAFAAAASVECIHAIKKKELIDLSVQQILDCTDTSRLRKNPSGEKNGGLTSWDRYPFPGWKTFFMGYKGKCNRKLAQHHVVRINGYRTFDINEDNLQEIVDVQPIVVTVETNENWPEYKGGVFDGYQSEASKCNHKVLIVGYGEDSEK
ncbi:Fruit bromelain, partial [Ananas comosus]